MTRQLHLLVKPASGSCDMRCRYCFYADVMRNRSVGNYGVMDGRTAEALVGKALAEAGEGCTFAFQGGEPTLAGLGFFERFVEIVKSRNARNVDVAFAIQTNGLSIDADWAGHFARNRYLVGLSLDGPREVHNASRVDAAGEGSYARVLRAAGLLKRRGVDFNILTVVTADVARRARPVYEHFRRLGFTYQQYIPCIEPFGGEPGSREWSLSPEDYGRFLSELFDLYYEDLSRGRRASVRYFDNLVRMAAGQPPESCGMSGSCSRQLVVEADGSVYPCDFYVTDGHRLGNLLEDGFDAIERRRDELGFIEESRTLDPGCRDCPQLPLCRGGCRRDRETGSGLSRNRLCAAYRGFLERESSRITRLARAFVR